MFRLTSAKEASAASRRVEFLYRAAAGQSVSVAGSFNDWDPEVLPMTYSAELAAYTAAVVLERGDYEYKFVVNGDWVIDEENPAFIANDFGTLNSVVAVE